MNKGLITLFAAATFACAGSVFAAAPVIGAIPDVSIGDTEPPESLQFTDSNFFVFTNAFNFDDKVSDPDNTDAELVWSFDEGDDDASGSVATKWYQINGKDPIHIGSTAIANQDGTTYDAHKAPGANELTQVSRWASFRDVVFSDPATPGVAFAAPTDPAKSKHAAGKLVVFAVSDGQNVTTKGITVKTVDNTSDTLSGGSPFKLDKDQTFDPVPPSADWSVMGGTNGVAGTSATPADAANTSYRITVSTIGPNRYHNLGWSGNRNTWISYSKIGSENYVRAKFYVYAASEGTGWTVNDIPAFAMRVSYRLSACVQQLVNPGDGAIMADVRPSTNAANPSVYRVDFDPVDVPYLRDYTNTAGQGEGIQAVFEVQEANGAKHGVLGMSELVFGTYPASYLTGTPAQSKYWDGTKNSSAGDLHMPDSAFSTLQLTSAGSTADSTCNDNATFAKVTRTEGSNGVTITGLGTNTYTGSGEWTLYPGNAIANTPDYGVRPRVAANMIYKTRFHMTSTQTSTLQSELWFGPRTLGNGFLCRAQFAGGTNTAGGKEANLTMIPGTQCLNPDKQASETNGGWYTVIMNSPYDADIRPDVTGDLSLKMPAITAERAYGDNTGGSKRDIKLTVQLWDSIPTGVNESGLVTVDRASLEAYPQFDDNN